MSDFLINLMNPFLLSLIVSLGIGLIVGMEREFENIAGREHYAGMRGFAIMSLLGCVVAFLSAEFHSNILLGIAPMIFIFVSVFHYSKIKQSNFGIVTELSLIIVFFLGVLSGLHYYKEALAVAVIVSTLLTLKTKLRETISHITQEELFAFVKFIILTLLVLPFLPDKNYGLGELFNLRSIGYVIVLASSLSFIGYFIIKFFGSEKGILFTAFFGGIVSSTAVTWVFCSRSRGNDKLSIQYASGISIACTLMFIRVLVIAGIFNVDVFRWLLIPCSLMIIGSSLATYILNRKKVRNSIDAPMVLGNPLKVTNALLFGLQYVGVTCIVYYAEKYLGQKGLMATGFISGLADIDAINISMSKLSISQISSSMAAMVILLAITSNTIVKIILAFIKGSKSLRYQVLAGLAPTILIAILSIVVIYYKK